MKGSRPGNCRERIVVIGAIVILALLALAWVGTSRWRTGQSPLPQQLRSAVTKTETFVKDHVTGGVGAVLAVDVTTGLPRIVSVVAGSPAESAGLLPGDSILRVNDTSTAGQSLAKVVDAIRGFSGGEVAVTIRREDATYLTFVLHRASWSSLGMTNQAGGALSAASGAVITNSSVVIQPGSFVMTNLSIHLTPNTTNPVIGP